MYILLQCPSQISLIWNDSNTFALADILSFESAAVALKGHQQQAATPAPEEVAKPRSLFLSVSFC